MRLPLLFYLYGNVWESSLICQRRPELLFSLLFHWWTATFYVLNSVKTIFRCFLVLLVILLPIDSFSKTGTCDCCVCNSPKQSANWSIRSWAAPRRKTHEIYMNPSRRHSKHILVSGRQNWALVCETFHLLLPDFANNRKKRFWTYLFLL